MGGITISCLRDINEAVCPSNVSPTGTNGSRCRPGVVNLSASAAGSGTLNWYNSAGTLVNTGNTYSPSITGSTNFYVAQMIANTITSNGEVDSAIGGGAFYSASTVQGLYFDVLKPCTLISVKTYSNLAGVRTIQVLDANGAVVQSASVNIPLGMSTVTLNFTLGAGTGYLIKLGSSSLVNLYRNSAGASFPYPNSVLNITRKCCGCCFLLLFFLRLESAAKSLCNTKCNCDGT